jgi:hypothetical protein
MSYQDDVNQCRRQQRTRPSRFKCHFGRSTYYLYDKCEESGALDDIEKYFFVIKKDYIE